MFLFSSLSCISARAVYVFWQPRGGMCGSRFRATVVAARAKHKKVGETPDHRKFLAKLSSSAPRRNPHRLCWNTLNRFHPRSVEDSRALWGTGLETSRVRQRGFEVQNTRPGEQVGMNGSCRMANKYNKIMVAVTPFSSLQSAVRSWDYSKRNEYYQRTRLTTPYLPCACVYVRSY